MTLDGKQVTTDELAKRLEEASKNPNVRIIEKEDGVFVTLKKLNG